MRKIVVAYFQQEQEHRLPDRHHKKHLDLQQMDGESTIQNSHYLSNNFLKTAVMYLNFRTYFRAKREPGFQYYRFGYEK